MMKQINAPSGYPCAYCFKKKRWWMPKQWRWHSIHKVWLCSLTCYSYYSIDRVERAIVIRDT